MAKYFIKFADNESGVKYLDCLKYRYFWFLDKKLIPNVKTLTYLQEVYEGNITDKISFGMHWLRTKNRKVIIKGYALVIKGQDVHCMVDDPIGIDWNFKEFEKKCKEIQQSVREYKTIISITRPYDHQRNSPTTGWNYYQSGYMALDFKYKIMRTSKKLGNSSYHDRGDDGHDYFSIPDGEDILNYTPNMGDLSSPYSSLFDQCIPYSEEAHRTLTAICEAGMNLGMQLDKMLSKREFLLSSMNKLLLPEQEEAESIKIANTKEEVDQ